MKDNGAHRSRIVWIASAVHPNWKIASPTVTALRALLCGIGAESTAFRAALRPATRDSGQADALSVQLADVPGLVEVGGVAKLVGDGGDTVGVARVGRTSFVGFKLDGEVLREIEVELDESAGRLRIVPTVDYPGPPPS